MGSRMSQNTAKGPEAEKLVASLLAINLPPHYIYLNPKHPDINKGKEICDVLVLLKNTAIVIQIKDIELGKHDFLDDAYEFKFDDWFRDFTGELRSDSKFLKNIRQCHGGARQILNSTAKITLKNEAGIEDVVHLDQINEAYCLAYYHGDKLRHDIWYDDTNKGFPVHIMCYEPFLQTIKEIYTIRDLTNYLHDKEDFLNECEKKRQTLDKSVQQIPINASEEDLFALWNQHRSFRDQPFYQQFLDSDSFYFDISGMYAEQQKNQEFQDARRENRHYIKYWNDTIKNTLDIANQFTQYKLIVDELVGLTFFDQVALGSGIESLIKTAVNYKDRDTKYFVRYFLVPLEKPENLYMIIISYNPSFIEKKRVIFETHASIFIAKHLAKLRSVKNIIGVMALGDAERGSFSQGSVGCFQVSQYEESEYMKSQSFKDLLDQTPVLRQYDRLVKNQLCDVGLIEMVE